METINWLWNSVTSTAEAVKKRAVTVRDWIWTNKGKSFAIFATITTLIYFITLVRRKRNPNNVEFPTQTPQSRNNQYRSKMQSYYENAQRGSNNTVNLLSVSLRDKLESILEIPSTAQLRSTMNKSNEEKVAIWDQVKLLTFTRTVSAVYGISLLFLFLRTKVNILGRYLYLDATVTSSSSDENPITEEIQKKYLIYSDYFLNMGIVDLVNYIQQQAEQELVMWPLTKKCTFEDVLTILTNIRVRLEEGQQKALFSFLLPTENSTENSEKQLLDLLNETRDVLESEQFARTLRGCLNASFIGLANQIKESFIANSPPSNSPTTSPNPGVALPMAKIIPLLNQKFRMLLDIENKQSLLNGLFSLREVEEYSNAIFTSSYEEED